MNLVERFVRRFNLAKNVTPSSDLAQPHCLAMLRRGRRSVLLLASQIPVSTSFCSFEIHKDPQNDRSHGLLPIKADKVI